MVEILECDDGIADPWAETLDLSAIWACCEAFAPRIKPLWLPWCKENVVTDVGRPYDHGAYPHIGAPGGPADAFDCPAVRRIILQWGSRLGKSFFGQCCEIFTAANDPAPMMDANPTEELTKNVMDRTYKMIRHRDNLRSLLEKRHEKDQKQTLMEFVGCIMYGAWARSAATLADKNIKVGRAGEVDKWEHATTASEADPLKLFDDRFKDYWSVRKQIVESTPAMRHKSRIEPLRLGGTDCHLQVPCPRCKQYQRLELGTRDGKHGLRWDYAESGRTDPAVAHATARYVCRWCLEAAYDHDRAWMIRRGVWVPAGCTVKNDVAIATAESRLRPTSEASTPWRGWKSAEWIEGHPYRDGTDASYQLSSLYALSLAWGDIASEFVKCHDRPQLLRNFVNQWLAETWEPRKSRSTPERIAEKLNTTLPTGLAPEWARFITVTADRQAADGGFVVYVVLAHGPDDRAAEIAHGQCETLDDLHANVINRTWQHADGGEPLRVVISGVDSGWSTKETYEFCNQHERCFAVKGSDGDLGGQPYRVVELGHGVRSGSEGQTLVHINTDYWETDLQHRLDDLSANAPGSLSISADAASDWDFINQLLNAVLTDKKNTRGNDRLLWVKKRESDPNDYRDAIRYGLALARAWLDEAGDMPVRRKPELQQVKAITDDAHRFVRKMTIRGQG